jgi:hypothetical protein
MTASFLSIAEYFVSTPKLLLFCIPMYILLHKTIERDDVCIKRGEKNDVSEHNLTDSV